MELKHLLNGLDVEVKGLDKLEVEAIASDSNKISKNALFIALKGKTFDGQKFAHSAVDQGAIAVLSSSLIEGLDSGICQILHPNPQALVPTLAARFYQFPAQELFTIGVTGTNGKTTCTSLIHQLLGPDHCGLIGTIEYKIQDEVIPASLTTPDVITNQSLLAQMRQKNMKAVAMEATSIALSLNRLDYIDFDVTVFTNFSQDHLDFHKTMQAYLEAKAQLFTRMPPTSTAIVNIDDAACPEMIQNCKANILTYGQNPTAELRFSNLKLLPTETQFDLLFKEQLHRVITPLIGEFNAYNTVAAIASSYLAGLSFETILERCKSLESPKGRLQPVANDLGAKIFVDFAHTDDALKNVLQALKKIPHRKIWTLFGCGGDRDPVKRPIMGKVVSQLSDVTLITSDNPRSEDPEAICQDILQGVDPNKTTLVNPDRKAAILQALNQVEKGDILLIAGRGHEPFQMMKGKKIPFSDYEMTQNLLKKLLLKS